VYSVLTLSYFAVLCGHKLDIWMIAGHGLQWQKLFSFVNSRRQCHYGTTKR